MPRIVTISDTHSRHSKISTMPEGDILIHSGDATERGGIDEIAAFNEWLGTLPYKHKIFVAGNHDWLFERSPQFAPTMMTNAHYLLDSFVVVEGLKIYGSPWQPRFFDWAFNRIRGAEIRKHWDLIPDKVDILITHGPAYGILDRTVSDEVVGCKDLLKRIAEVKPAYHIFGHIHEGYGMLEKDGTVFINAIAGIDDSSRDMLRQKMRRTTGTMPHYHHIHFHGQNIVYCIE